ncbi:hypothetical protein BV25DRAFT_1774341, partial [Artomyces pyxidatus]
AKRRKVNHACLYCRRSHMTCDEGRPCQRCIKREIGHLCHDENRTSKGDKQPAPAASSSSQPPQPATTSVPCQAIPAPTSAAAWSSMAVQQQQNAYMSSQASRKSHRPFSPFVTLNLSFPPSSVLSDFLETLDEQAFFNPTGGVAPALSTTAFATPDLVSASQTPSVPSQNPVTTAMDLGLGVPAMFPGASMTEKFLLTAADQEPGSRDERLKRVIRTKYEAGLLKPYNYVKGYARLSRWMDRNVSQESKQQILQPLSVLRPKFRAIAQSLRDIDLVFIEEAFERLMLDYDRVFSSMGIPACLWRRTGEIYKGNRAFAELVGVDGYMLRDGRLCIYELMAEESAVNYWEKYGNVAFDSTQKAVLTSCVLRYKPAEGFINCCFSFTIRRDTWGIPSMIVGNFIR